MPDEKKSRKVRPAAEVVVDKLLNLETLEAVAKALKARSPAAARMLADLLAG